MKNLPRLCFLTEDQNCLTHAQLAQQALAGGVRWVQLRSKTLLGEKLKTCALEVQEVCKKFTALLLINDNVELALEIDADGVHLGAEDMSIADARKILGPCKIIGRTCHNAQDLHLAAQFGADYAGVGPFAISMTKDFPADKQFLGIQGLRELSLIEPQLKKIAIGGISISDLASIRASGFYGVAVCSQISRAKNLAHTAQNFSLGVSNG